MFKFKTKNSTYYVDTKNKTISGGVLSFQREYISLKAMIGEPAVVYMANGEVITTSPVVKLKTKIFQKGGRELFWQQRKTHLRGIVSGISLEDPTEKM